MYYRCKRWISTFLTLDNLIFSGLIDFKKLILVKTGRSGHNYTAHISRKRLIDGSIPPIFYHKEKPKKREI